MWKNYLTTALRNLRKRKGYAFINIFGLAAGLTCCLLILLYVQDERRYDRHHANADRIYRLTSEIQGDQYRHDVSTPSLFGPAFAREFPEIEAFVRLYNPTAYGPVVVRHGETAFQETRFFYADSALFDVFSFPFLRGDPAQALTRPNTVVLTQTTARKYFGTGDPIGEVITYENRHEFEVTGVIEDLPPQSHLHFDFVASLSSLSGWSQLSDDQWLAMNFSTYLLLQPGQTGGALEAKLAAYLAPLLHTTFGEADLTYTVHAQPLTRIHLYSDVEGEYEPQGDVRYLYAFAAIGLLILLIACINYMNLATARAAQRAKEVGMRKALGAYRSQLTQQFYGESALTTLLALSLAAVLTAGLLPVFNRLTGKHLTFATLDVPFLLACLLGTGLVVALLAGSYPALVLSSFRPTAVLKGSVRLGTAGAFIRRGLVVFQFAVSVFLIVGTLVVYQQIDYMQRAKLTLDDEQVLVLPVGDPELRSSYPVLKQALLQHPRMTGATVVSRLPGRDLGGYGATAEGLEGRRLVAGLAVDEGAISTLGLTLKAGRGYPDTYTPDMGYLFVLNETAARTMGWTPEEAVERPFDLNGREGRVVGVVEDFAYGSLRDAIPPIVLFTANEDLEYLLVKTSAADLPNTMAYAQDTWADLAPHRPFVYSFLDQEFDALYRAERRVGQLFALFAGLAILIACLGLFGLAAFTAQQRTKEIGIRKVLGAPVSSLIFLLSRDFAWLVLIALVVASPLAYFAMSRWLQNFAYSIDLGPGAFLVAGVLAVAIAFATVSYQSVKAALADPVETLKYE